MIETLNNAFNLVELVKLLQVGPVYDMKYNKKWDDSFTSIAWLERTCAIIIA